MSAILIFNASRIASFANEHVLQDCGAFYHHGSAAWVYARGATGGQRETAIDAPRERRRQSITRIAIASCGGESHMSSDSARLAVELLAEGLLAGQLS